MRSGACAAACLRVVVPDFGVKDRCCVSRQLTACERELFLCFLYRESLQLKLFLCFLYRELLRLASVNCFFVFFAERCYNLICFFVFFTGSCYGLQA